MPTHVFTTGYLTEVADPAIFGQWFRMPVVWLLCLGEAWACGWFPTLRDLHFAWEEMPQQVLDEQQEKMRQSGRNALLRLGCLGR